MQCVAVCLGVPLGSLAAWLDVHFLEISGVQGFIEVRGGSQDRETRTES